MVVGRDRWDGNVRHVEEVRELRDVAVVGPRRLRRRRPRRVPNRPTAVAAAAHNHTLTVEQRTAAAGRPVEERILEDAMRGVPPSPGR